MYANTQTTNIKTCGNQEVQKCVPALKKEENPYQNHTVFGHYSNPDVIPFE